jgi:adenine-specific DNA-methyltransferase
VIKYIGSKRTLVPVILDVVRRCASSGDGGGDNDRELGTVIDLFSGTSRVGHALKATGYRVLANDHNAYAATLARCYVQTDAEDVLDDARKLLREFNRLPGMSGGGYFTETFCVKSRFFQPKNGERIDAIREAIAAKSLEPELEAVMLVSLMEAADRVDSTTGLQMAYLKDWAPRAFNDLELRVPDVLPRAKHGKGQATCMDALDAAKALEGEVAYIDPPYNQHSYLGNYHVWESLVRWDKPEVYGIACKRVDVRQRQSVFNSRPRFAQALREVLGAVRAPTLIISFNNEGYLSREEMEAMLAGLWDGGAQVTTIENDFKRYVGAQIGIYNPQGERVGKISHLRNKEYLYVVSREDLTERLRPMCEAIAEPVGLFG